MKTFLFAAAAALVFAAPAGAQATQGQQHNADHAQHQGHGQEHGQHKQQDHSQHQTGHAQHDGQDHSPHAECCGDANGNGRMDCCEDGAEKPCCAQHREHGQSAQPSPAQPQNR